jgi:hypothetical protein
LENEITNVRREQTRLISDLKAKFLQEKSEHKKTADERIQAIVKIANREARDCLSENTFKIKEENQMLRSELFELIKVTKELTLNKHRLDEQRANLLIEIKYAEDLKKVRSTQQKRVVEKLFNNNSN